MDPFLILLDDLDEGDLDWILSEGVEQQVIANETIIHEGEVPNALYIVIHGLLGIQISSIGETTYSLLGPGEIIGEMSILEDIAATATVSALESTLLLAFPRGKIKAKLREDMAFAARFYKSLAICNAHRLRECNGKLGLELKRKQELLSDTDEKWGEISSQIHSFKRLIQKADQEALKENDHISQDTEKAVKQAFGDFTQYINQQIGEGSSMREQRKKDLGYLTQLEILPFLLLTEIAEMAYSKPRGYAGDYLTILKMYENKGSGSGRVGPLLDRCFLDEPAAKAICNRRGLMCEEILEVVKNTGDGVTRVTSLASGPASEIFDVFARLQSPSQLKVKVVDLDYQALAFVTERMKREKLGGQIDPVFGNFVYLATGRKILDIPEQDLVYSLGLIDYFNDKLTIKLINFIFGILKVGGKVILGNFHPCNTTRALMDHILNWKLVHRTEEDMNKLFSQSLFKSPCTEIRFEDAGVDLFAQCIKRN